MLCRRGTGGERDGAGDGRGIGAREEGQKVGELTLSSHAWTATARRGGIRRNRRGERRGRGGKVEDAAVDFQRPQLDSSHQEGEEEVAERWTASASPGDVQSAGNRRRGAGIMAGRNQPRELDGVELDPGNGGKQVEQVE